MTGAASSLNAANAATAILYEIARQRILADRAALTGHGPHFVIRALVQRFASCGGVAALRRRARHHRPERRAGLIGRGRPQASVQPRSRRNRGPAARSGRPGGRFAAPGSAGLMCPPFFVSVVVHLPRMRSAASCRMMSGCMIFS